MIGLMQTPPVPEEINESISRSIAFGASWNRSTRLLSVLFLVVGSMMVYLSYPGVPLSAVFLMTSTAVCLAVGLAYWFAPIGYLVSDAGVAIRRPAGLKELPFGILRSSRLMESSELAECTWRWPAVGGLFGFFGTFETPALGRHRWFCSRDQDLVLLQTAEGPIILSPDDPQAFVREVNQRLRASQRI